MRLPFILALVTTPFSIAENCYWPNGDLAEDNWVRCPGRTNCCASGEACLTNNLCYQAHMNIAYRGACADKSWPISSCPRLCYEEVPDLWANIFACPNNTNQVYTCGRPGGWAKEVCNDQMDQYTWDVKPTYKVEIAQLPPSTATAATSSSSATITNTPTPTATSTTSESSTATSDPIAKPEGSSSSNAVAIAAGLGAGLGVPLLLVSLGFLLLWARSRKRTSESRVRDLHQGPFHGMNGQDEFQSLSSKFAFTPSRELDASRMSERRGELEG